MSRTSTVKKRRIAIILVCICAYVIQISPSVRRYLQSRKALPPAVTLNSIIGPGHFIPNGTYELADPSIPAYANNLGCNITRIQGLDSCGTEYCEKICFKEPEGVCFQGFCAERKRSSPTIFMCATEDPLTCTNAEYTTFEDNPEDGLEIMNITNDRFNFSLGIPEVIGLRLIDNADTNKITHIQDSTTEGPTKAIEVTKASHSMNYYTFVIISGASLGIITMIIVAFGIYFKHFKKDLRVGSRKSSEERLEANTEEDKNCARDNNEKHETLSERSSEETQTLINNDNDDVRNMQSSYVYPDSASTGSSEVSVAPTLPSIHNTGSGTVNVTIQNGRGSIDHRNQGVNRVEGNDNQITGTSAGSQVYETHILPQHTTTSNVNEEEVSEKSKKISKACRLRQMSG